MPANPPSTVAEAIEAAARVAENYQRYCEQRRERDISDSSWREWDMGQTQAGKIAAAIRALAPGVSTSAPAQAAPSGWRLVPVEPTTDMKRALALAVGGNWDIGHYAWERGIAAAPPHPHPAQGESGDITQAWVEAVGLADTYRIRANAAEAKCRKLEGDSARLQRLLRGQESAGGECAHCEWPVEVGRAQDRIRELEGEIARLKEKK